MTRLGEQMERIEELVDALERQPVPAARVAAQELMHTLLALHAAGLARLLDGVRQLGGGDDLIRSVAGDELVGSLLLLHGLHPVAAADRVRDALTALEPKLQMHGAIVAMRGIRDGVLSVQIDAASPAASAACERLIEAAVREAAPDLTAITFAAAREQGSRRPLPLVMPPGAMRHE